MVQYIQLSQGLSGGMCKANWPSTFCKQTSPVRNTRNIHLSGVISSSTVLHGQETTRSTLLFQYLTITRCLPPPIGIFHYSIRKLKGYSFEMLIWFADFFSTNFNKTLVWILDKSIKTLNHVLTILKLLSNFRQLNNNKIT